ncbi:FadR/GntR family transcriptional regulator [Pseudalkalibacillus berkeleyi]|uniref:GntR family transcriptional regulator n=1 Tax=Pseudalkalibacillus berkeleyi TaxID=1069813 RepID=A0ABS9GZN4_9BACL|nr:GntR family transcriptional regulator [Pseudalkalibacillus berkeleyi]MCF6138207.1 GntR family transcriptional regulator [Pseudalkalibacillus berkeleyi]
MFVEILNKLKAIIQKDQLLPGDKLPSERELSDRLNVGRSSVREALRAMELLGLIETRRGEGTFIKEARNHRLVEVLASFILNDGLVKQELTETREIIERNAVVLASQRRTEEELKDLEAYLADIPTAPSARIDAAMDRTFFHMVLKASNNSLLHRLWVELTEYDQFNVDSDHTYPKSKYDDVFTMIKNGIEIEQHSAIKRNE